MINLRLTPLLLAFVTSNKTKSIDAQKDTDSSDPDIHIAVPMFVHSYVPMQARSLPHAGGLLGGRIVGERSNGGRSVGIPHFSSNVAQAFAL